MFFKDAQKKWRHSILLIGRKLYVRQISYVYTHLLFYFFFFILFYSVNYKYKNIKKTKKWAFKKTGYNTGMGGNQKISWCIEQSTREEKWCVNEINFRRPGLILAGMETEEIGPNLLL